MPLIWAYKFCEIANPAASSAPLLIRNPEDKRCTDAARELWAPDRLFWANSDETFVFIESISYFIKAALQKQSLIMANGIYFINV